MIIYYTINADESTQQQVVKTLDAMDVKWSETTYDDDLTKIIGHIETLGETRIEEILVNIASSALRGLAF